MVMDVESDVDRCGRYGYIICMLELFIVIGN